MWDRIKGVWTVAGDRYLARLRQNTGVRRLRMLEGKWVAAEGQVYEAWDPEEYLIDANDLLTLGITV
jgi:phage terminase large subunit